MAWVQVGNRKINTAMLCYMEQQEDEKLRLYFTGQSNALELSPEESRGLWKHLKAEDALAVKDKGSAMVLPKRWSAAPGDVIPAANTPAKPLQVTVGQDKNAPAPAAAVAPSSQPKPHSGSHSQSHSSSHKPHSSSSHNSSSHRPSSSHSSSSSSQHRSNSSPSHSSSSSSSKSTDSARVLEFRKES